MLRLGEGAWGIPTQTQSHKTTDRFFFASFSGCRSKGVKICVPVMSHVGIVSDR